MTLDLYLLFLPACFAINMAFGPNNLLSLSNGARDGTARAVAAASGRLVAFAIMIAIAGFGLGTLLVASEIAFAVVKWLGAAYLVWLGIRLLRAGAPALDQAAAAGPQPLRALVRQEFWVAMGNPKAILVFTAFFPQFVVPTDYAASFAVLGASFLALEVVAITVCPDRGPAGPGVPQRPSLPLVQPDFRRADDRLRPASGRGPPADGLESGLCSLYPLMRA